MLKRIFIFLAAVLTLVVVAGIFLPKEFSIEREVTINRSVDFAFEQLRSIKNHASWSPWMKKDPQIVNNYSGTDGTVGFISSWSGNREVGVGEQEIKNIVPNQRIDFELRFKEPMEDTSTGYLITEALAENRVKVKWGMNGKSPFPFNVFCFVMGMKDKLGAEFQSGLDTLKTQLEGNTP